MEGKQMALGWALGKGQSLCAGNGIYIQHRVARACSDSLIFSRALCMGIIITLLCRPGNEGSKALSPCQKVGLQTRLECQVHTGGGRGEVKEWLGEMIFTRAAASGGHSLTWRSRRTRRSQATGFLSQKLTGTQPAQFSQRTSVNSQQNQETRKWDCDRFWRQSGARAMWRELGGNGTVRVFYR